MAALAVAGAVLVLLPIAGVLTRVDWTDFGAQVTSPQALTALGLSLRTALVATVACLVIGVPLGYALAVMRSRWKAVLRALVLAPLVLPPVVGGLALLYAFGRRGLLGGTFEALGISIAFSTAAVVIAQTFVALPFMVLTTESAIAARGTRQESIARMYGASRTRTFAWVTLPALLPALAAGTVLAFARAIGEFGATLTFAGSLEGVTRTAPLEIYLQREGDPGAAVALSLVLLIVAVAVVAVAYRPLTRASAT
jgi:molybdate transport system permease protein